MSARESAIDQLASLMYEDWRDEPWHHATPEHTEEFRALAAAKLSDYRAEVLREAADYADRRAEKLEDYAAFETVFEVSNVGDGLRTLAERTTS